MNIDFLRLFKSAAFVLLAVLIFLYITLIFVMVYGTSLIESSMLAAVVYVVIIVAYKYLK